MKSIKAVELVEDFSLYPRGGVDSSHVTSLAHALETGAKLPPIVACRKTLRIADGFHRRRAYIKVYGEDTSVPVELRTYKTEADLYADAMRFNSAHGRRLTAVDFARATLRGRSLGMDDVAIAKCLNCTVDRVKDLVVDRTATCGALSVPLKRTVRHMAGKALTEEQAAVNDKLGGMQAGFHVNQLIMLIENKMLDMSNESLLEDLEKLADLIVGLKVA